MRRCVKYIASLNNSQLYAMQRLSIEEPHLWQRLAGRDSAGRRFRFLFHGCLQPKTTGLNRLTISPRTESAARKERIDGKRLMETSGNAACNSSGMIHHFRFNKRRRSNIVDIRASFILAVWCIVSAWFFSRIIRTFPDVNYIMSLF